MAFMKISGSPTIPTASIDMSPTSMLSTTSATARGVTEPAVEQKNIADFFFTQRGT